MPSSDAQVKLYYSNAWNDITADTFGRDDIRIVAGQQDEASAADPASCSVTLNNGTSKVDPTVTGRYTPRNPLSDLYGKISRNDKFRVEVAATGREGMWLPGETGAYASTPDAAGLDTSGDVDIRIEVEPDTWRPGDDVVLCAKATDASKSWQLRFTPTGILRWQWSSAGASFAPWADSTAAVPSSAGRLVVRIAMGVDVGGQREITFYTSDDGLALGDEFKTWTLLGATVTGSPTSIFDSTAPVTIGAYGDGSTLSGGDLTFSGRIYAFQLRTGIAAGTLAADVDFATQDPDDRSFRDDTLLTWTLHDQARIVRPDIRFCGGIPAWPPRWDVSGSDLWVPIEAAGVLRRMSQGASALRSSLYRDLSTKTNLVAYWPCEDGESATTIAAAIGDQDLNVFGDVTLASDADVTGSDALPTFVDGTFMGRVPYYDVPADQRIFCVVNVPETVPGTSRSVLQLRSTGDVEEWRLRVTSAGELTVHGWDLNGTEVVTATHSVDLRGKVAVVWLWLEDDGPDTNWQIGSVEPGQALPVSVVSGTRTGNITGRFTSIIVGSGADLGGAAIGHVALMDSDVHGEFWDTIGSSLVAWTGEQAHARFTRLADEESITGIVHGSESQQMGAQTISTLLDLWQQCADTDLARVNEYGCDGFLFRAHRELENQDPKITLDYTLGHLSPPLEPTDDDQQLRNDVTVTRVGGSSAHATLATGPLSIAEVGRYDASLDLSLHQDGQTHHQAWWRLHLGTVDEARYPSVTIDLLRNPSLRADVLSLEPGDKIRITNLPAWLPPDDVDLLISGRDETIGANGRHLVTFVCTPASPWTVGIAGNADYGRADTLNSEVAQQFFAGTNTTLRVATIAGPLWTTDPAEFPFHITVSGVTLNVTAIANSVNPLQDFTVDQTPVNGVVKEILEGEKVNLAQPAIAAL